MAKFIEVRNAFGTKTIAIDQIASLEPTIGGTKITLKTVEKGENVVVLCLDNYHALVEIVERNTIN